MATRKAPYSAKVKMWLPTMTADLEGGLRGCTVEMFRSLPADQRMKALHDMQKAHEEITEREAQKQAAAE
ncbi:hypothetical protein [Serratia marcescens]|uniref:hypothetical protein n=1 Tax=Serratia marcescens TaxID=615 RepID=UPI0024A6E7BC|nr:hypothetical protein [Serratia marcescens]